jgi:hypothetical protein
LAGVVIVAVRCAFDGFELEPVQAALKPNAATSTAAAMPRDTARRRTWDHGPARCGDPSG